MFLWLHNHVYTMLLQANDIWLNPLINKLIREFASGLLLLKYDKIKLDAPL